MEKIEDIISFQEYQKRYEEEFEDRDAYEEEQENPHYEDYD